MAVSEVLTLMMKHVPFTNDFLQIADSTEGGLGVKFAIEPDRIEILMTCAADYASRGHTEDWQESEAVLGSLMDEIGYGIEGTGETIVRMVKRK